MNVFDWTVSQHFESRRENLYFCAIRIRTFFQQKFHIVYTVIREILRDILCIRATGDGIATSLRSYLTLSLIEPRVGWFTLQEGSFRVSSHESRSMKYSGPKPGPPVLFFGLCSLMLSRSDWLSCPLLSEWTWDRGIAPF